MGEKICLADKETLDKTKKNTDDIVQNTNLIKENMKNILPEQFTLDKYNIIGVNNTLYFDETVYTEHELISIQSPNGGIFRYLDVMAKMNISGEGYYCDKPIIKVVIDDVEYELIKANKLFCSHTNYHPSIQAIIGIEQKLTINECFNGNINESKFVDETASKFFSPNKQFDDIKSKIEVKTLAEVKDKNEKSTISIDVHGDKYMKFKKNFKLIVGGNGCYYPVSKLGAIVKFLGGVRID
ncbi:hypothetical protein [Clostridium sp. L74]|uniref:hypothetical protein n=1 Tax=Clostridium sp. L74 TaxID=1560217 RepID=UPI0006ABB126|nr:hypothetical protein [Clostridium sp. L74]KOR24208.1 hypothetical protein ND00_29140 [Clostridium sp. L74]